VLLIAGSVWAADIFTPVLAAGDAGAVVCQVLNTGNTTANGVTIEIRNSANNTPTETDTVDIESGTTGGVSELDPVPLVYCKVSGISKAKARVTLCLLDSGEKCTSAVTAP
jgi:hypothetical protein